MSANPAISVLVPTLNEQDWIEHSISTVRAALRTAGVAGEIVVCDGGSTDETRRRAEMLGVDRIVTAGGGRAAQLDAGARESTGETLAMLHADAIVRPEWVAEIVESIDAGAAGGWFQIEILPELGTLQGANGLELMAAGINARTRATEKAATADQSIFVRRSVFEAIGGVPDLPILEGNALARRIAEHGPVSLGGPHVRISGRRWERGGLLRTMFLMFAIRGAFHLGVDPARLRHVWDTLSSS